MRRRRGQKRCPGLAAGIFLVLALCSERGRAGDTAPLELDWNGVSPCPAEAEVRRRIRELAPTPAPRTPALRASARVEREADRFVLDLVLEDGALVGRRHFEGDSCDEVVGAAAVAIALLLRSNRESSEREAEPGAADEGAAQAGIPAKNDAALDPARSRHFEARATAPDKDAPPRETPSGRSEEHHLGPLSAVLQGPALAVGVGLLSAPSFGPSLGVGVELGRWRATLSAAWYPERALPLGGSPGAGARVGRQVAALSLCRWFLGGRFQLAPCASAGVQRLSARGVGARVTSNEVVYPWAVFGPRALARLRLSELLSLGAAAGLDVQAAHPSLEIEGLNEVEQIGAVEFTTLVGAEWIF